MGLAEYCRARAQIRLSRDKNRGGWLRFSSLRSPGEITALKERNLPHIYHENEFRKVEERTVYLTCMCMMMIRHEPRVEGEKEREKRRIFVTNLSILRDPRTLRRMLHLSLSD